MQAWFYVVGDIGLSSTLKPPPTMPLLDVWKWTLSPAFLCTTSWGRWGSKNLEGHTSHKLSILFCWSLYWQTQATSFPSTSSDGPELLKVRQSRNDFFKPTFCPKKEKTNSTLLLWYLKSTCFRSFFWRKSKTTQNHFEVIWPLNCRKYLVNNY